MIVPIGQIMVAAIVQAAHQTVLKQAVPIVIVQTLRVMGALVAPIVIRQTEQVGVAQVAPIQIAPIRRIMDGTVNQRRFEWQGIYGAVNCNRAIFFSKKFRKIVWHFGAIIAYKLPQFTCQFAHHHI